MDEEEETGYAEDAADHIVDADEAEQKNQRFDTMMAQAESKQGWDRHLQEQRDTGTWGQIQAAGDHMEGELANIQRANAAMSGLEAGGNAMRDTGLRAMIQQEDRARNQQQEMNRLRARSSLSFGSGHPGL